MTDLRSPTNYRLVGREVVNAIPLSPFWTGVVYERPGINKVGVVLTNQPRASS